MNSIIYKGKKYTYRDLKELQNKLEITNAQAKRLVGETTDNYVAINNDGETYKFIKSEVNIPLLRREFGVKDVQDLWINGKDINDQGIVNLSGFDIDEHAVVNVEIMFNVFFSEESKKIKINVIYNKEDNFIDDRINNASSIRRMKKQISDYENKGKLPYVVRDKKISDKEYKKLQINEIKKIKENLPTDSNLETLPISELDYWAYDQAKNWCFFNGAILDKSVEVAFCSSSYYDDVQMKIKDGKMKSDNILEIQKFLNIISESDEDNECVRNYLKSKYPKISRKIIESLGNKDGVTTAELQDFCKQYAIKMTAYDINGVIIAKTKGDNNKAYASLLFMTHLDHLYPIRGKKLIKNNDINQTILVTNAKNKLAKFINEGIEPYEIKINTQKVVEYTDNIVKLAESNITSFVCNNNKYIQNDEYKLCRKILQTLGFGLDSKITDGTRIITIMPIIESHFIQDSIDSFIPNSHLFNKSGYSYCKDPTAWSKYDIVSIDKNSSYTHALYNLPYLIVTDYRTATITKSPEEIVDHYLYLIDPLESTILLPKRGLYAGYHLKLCKKYKLEFTIIEEITTRKSPNMFKKIINFLNKKIGKECGHCMKCIHHKESPECTERSKCESCKKNKEHKLWTKCSTVKNILNFAIGNMIRSEKEFCKVTNPRIVKKDSDEFKTFAGNVIQLSGLSEEYAIKYEVETKLTNIYTRLPIHCQILDMARVEVFKKMFELELTDNEIVQVHTDSISYISTVVPRDLDPNNFNGWKKSVDIPYKSAIVEINNTPISLYMKSPLNQGKTRELHNCYAGVGKTYYILNTLIPYLEANKTSFRILTPSHASLQEYHANGYTDQCNVIQKNSFANHIPDEDYIIIDEIGMCGKEANNILYSMHHFGKDYSAFGDFDQVPPVDSNEPYNSKQYLQFMYNTQPKILDENKRNDFPFEYYDKLINEEIDFKEEVHKYSTKKAQDAEIILCWRNKTADIYNDKMIEKMKTTKYSVGVRYICKTKQTNGKLLERDIYNGRPIKILEVLDGDKFLVGEDEDVKEKYIMDADGVRTEDDNDFSAIVTKQELDKYFKLAYCVNVYQIQGQTLKSYHWAKCDDCFLDGRKAYTIISRLSGNVYEDNITDNNCMLNDEELKQLMEDFDD